MLQYKLVAPQASLVLHRPLASASPALTGRAATVSGTCYGHSHCHQTLRTGWMHWRTLRPPWQSLGMQLQSMHPRCGNKRNKNEAKPGSVHDRRSASTMVSASCCIYLLLILLLLLTLTLCHAFARLLTQISIMLANAACTSACAFLLHALSEVCALCGVVVKNPCLDVAGTLGFSLSAKLTYCTVGMA